MSGTTESDLAWLRRTFELACASVDAGDQAFAALLVDGNGRLLVEAANRRERSGDCTAHAETDIAREATLRWTRVELAGCTMFSSTEPCPMCSGAIGWSDVGRLVYGLSQRRMYEVYAGNTPRWAEPPSCRAILATVVPPLEIVGPLLEGEAVEPHRYWVKVNT